MKRTLVQISAIAAALALSGIALPSMADAAQRQGGQGASHAAGRGGASHVQRGGRGGGAHWGRTGRGGYRGGGYGGGYYGGGYYGGGYGGGVYYGGFCGPIQIVLGLCGPYGY